MMKYFIIIIFFLMPSAFAEGRFFYEGDGCLRMFNDKTKSTFNGCYRNADGTYNDEIITRLDSFFQVPKDLDEHFSLRTLAFLDFLQDKYVKPKIKLKVTSAFRTPEYNQKLRKKGKLAGKTSYHLEAMAVDVIFPGVKSEKIWEYARGLNYGGMGYYRSKALHVDSGKPRSWVPETAIEPDNILPLNKNIYLSVDKDIYYVGETISLFFSGISDYPYGVQSAVEISADQMKLADVQPQFSGSKTGGCIAMTERADSRSISWKIPEDFSTRNKKIHFHVKFCDPTFANQPAEIDSREFEIR